MGNTTTIRTVSSEETSQFGQKLATGIVDLWNRHMPERPHVFCLFGNLGSGKTTFTQGFARGLGITSRVLSPTFLISKRYSTPFATRFLYHLDIYRMDSPGSLQTIGINEILTDVRSCIIIEWAEKLQSFLPQQRTELTFTVEPDGAHRIDIQQYDFTPDSN